MRQLLGFMISNFSALLIGIDNFREQFAFFSPHTCITNKLETQKMAFLLYSWVWSEVDNSLDTIYHRRNKKTGSWVSPGYSWRVSKSKATLRIEPLTQNCQYLAQPKEAVHHEKMT